MQTTAASTVDFVANRRLARAREPTRRHPPRRTDRERQVGAGACARGAARRHRHQRRFHAGLSRPAHHHRAADAGRGGARAASALRPCRRGGELFGRPLVRRCERGARGGAAGPGACRSSWAAPGSISRRSRAGLPPCRRSRPTSARRCARGSRPRASRRSMTSLRRDPLTAHRLMPGDRAAHHARARGRAGDRAARSPTGIVTA